MSFAYEKKRGGGRGGSEMTGIELLAAERQRQVAVEGWSSEHDDDHIMGEMIGAAVTYAAHALEIVSNGEVPGADSEGWWPWDDRWYKPSPDAIKNLVKAGALIAAEIDRLHREAERCRQRRMEEEGINEQDIAETMPQRDYSR